ncbi:N-formylglutamate amidohydrolase [Croceicoccus ponticola]|uniref:N-formylglutamate amidohydrolase n=1 Tax=Croceicoccus ponticola TaxID=2217664 RepID=A0A437GZW2_9SPHN|nr:N-formylglutamate amidohydrolase [Croceicoccus ponticola]RVQ68916.1 N-formylglutamate amidohydrolase [Croceicoccus ponticola]
MNPERPRPDRTPTAGAANGGFVVEAGGSVPGLARPAFTLHQPAAARVPVIIAVPHAGRAYSPDLMGCMRHPAETPLRLEDRFVDAVAREVASSCGAQMLVAHAPRAMIDLNRDPRDFDLAMFSGSEAEKAAMRRDMPRGGAQSARSLRGLGLFPRRLAGIGELWRAPMRPVDAQHRIAAIHAPYHDTLARVLAEIREIWGAALLVDMHSMPDLPHGAAGITPATHVIGDRFGASCGRDVVAAAMGALDRAGAACAYNRPYAGGYVLDRHGKPRSGIHAVQVEIARSLYLDEALEQPGNGVERQAKIVAEMVKAMAAMIDTSGDALSQAAE